MSSLAYDPASGLPRRGRQTIPELAADPFALAPSARPDLGYSPAATTGPGRSIEIPGYQPDYRRLIEDDPVYQQFRADLAGQQIADRAQLAAARRRALIQFGEIPDLSGDLLGLVGADIGEDVTDEVRRLAQQNTQAGLSVAGKLTRQHERNIQSLLDWLASRGALRSGATGIALNQENQAYTEAQGDARQNLVDYLSGFQRGYTDAQARRARESAEAASRGAGFQAGLPQNQPTPSRTAVYDHTDPAGRPVYRGPDGKLYNPDGSEYTAPAGQPATTTPQPDRPVLVRPRRTGPHVAV